MRATLRPYQVDGFRWLSSLSELGLGACLADDMGLGKTIQILALLLARVAEAHGPTLVVAPTSVCGNWIAEIARFAPTLNAIEYVGKERAARACRAVRTGTAPPAWSCAATRCCNKTKPSCRR